MATVFTIDSVRSAIAERRTTATSLADEFYTRIKQEDPEIGSFRSLAKAPAVARPGELEKTPDAGLPPPPLAGVPVAIKDVMVTRDQKTTAGSKILETLIPPYDCTAVTRMEAAGAMVLGKLNCDEFAMGSSTENWAYHPVRIPRDTSRVPGGSSGGSAAAVAAGMAVATLGSDTGGSIRQPASFCGVVGLKPTYGRVSRYGLIAFASSLDHIGPFAKTVKEVALVLRTIAGRDPMDSTSADVPVPDYVAELEKPVKGLSAGYYDAYYLKAQKVRTLLTRDFDEAFKKVDVIAAPTCPTAAFRLGEKVNDPLAMYLADIYTVTANLAGIPGISVPCGENHEKLPIGLQLFGRHFDEATILRVAHAYEQARG